MRRVRFLNFAKSVKNLFFEVPFSDFREGRISYERDVIFWGKAELCNVPKQVSKRQRHYLTRVLKDVAKIHAKTHYVDLHDNLCKKINCGLLDPTNGKLLYGDYGSHFRVGYASPLSREWVLILNRYLPRGKGNV
jgi:hypothetical protein